MARNRNDYTVRENKQTQRLQEKLWDVTYGGKALVTSQLKERAQDIANELNKNPYYLDFLTYQGKGSVRKTQKV